MKRKRCNLVNLLVVLALLWPVGAFAADDVKSMFKEGITEGLVRVYHWTKDFDSFGDGYYENEKSDNSKTFVVGGTLNYETAPLEGFSLGMGMRYQYEIEKYDEYGSYYYFFPQSGPNVNTDPLVGVGEAYLRYTGFDTTATYGRQTINTPYMNVSDFRLLPKQYQGLSVYNNSLEDWEFNLGYFTQWADWWDGDYKKMISTASFEELADLQEAGELDEGALDDTKAALYAGVGYLGVEGLDASFWHYNFEDMYAINTVGLKYFKVLNRYWKGFIEARYTKWDDTGDALIGPVDTDMVGFKGMLSTRGWTGMLYWQQNGDQNSLELFGHSRIITQAVERCERAEEQAYLLQLGYDFTNIGLRGLSATIRHANYDTPDSGVNAEQDFTETDYIVGYEFTGPLRGLSLMIKYCLVDRDEDQADLNGDNFPVHLPFGTIHPMAKMAADATDVRMFLEYTW